jgi:uncharacterized protein YtpQ (UPF0354 family)
VRLQLRSRYHGVDVEVDQERFALRLRGPGIDTSLPLAPLQHTVAGQPEQAATHIARYVAAVEHQLQPHVATTFALSRALWCVRAARYLRGLTRAAELLVDELPGGLVAFVAEELPGSIMRGVPRPEWEQAGCGEAEVRAAAHENVERRFARLADRVRVADRVPADGWRMSADPLFQGSVLLATTVLDALHDRCAGDVLLGNPDRGVMLAIAASAASAPRFARRVTQEYRDAMNPVSRGVIRYDGERLQAEPGGRRRLSAPVLPWLQG